jgi:hypothetical protein
VDDEQADQRHRTREEPGYQGSSAERTFEGLRTEPPGISGEVDGGQVSAGGAGQYADEHRRRVEPTADLIALRVAHRHPAGGDRAGDGAQRERREDRGESEQYSIARPPRAPSSCPRRA